MSQGGTPWFGGAGKSGYGNDAGSNGQRTVHERTSAVHRKLPKGKTGKARPNFPKVSKS
jgi:hypothetical protein